MYTKKLEVVQTVNYLVLGGYASVPGGYAKFLEVILNFLEVLLLFLEVIQPLVGIELLWHLKLLLLMPLKKCFTGHR